MGWGHKVKRACIIVFSTALLVFIRERYAGCAIFFICHENDLLFYLSGG